MSTETPANYRKRLKKKIDKVFSEYIRRESKGICYTCDKRYDWKKEMDAGHFIHNKLDFDLMNRKGQCKRCNQHLHGNLGIYAEKLIKEYGLERIEEMRLRSNQIWKPSTEELEALLSHWEAELAKLKSLKMPLNKREGTF